MHCHVHFIDENMIRKMLSFGELDGGGVRIRSQPEGTKVHSPSSSPRFLHCKEMLKSSFKTRTAPLWLTKSSTVSGIDRIGIPGPRSPERNSNRQKDCHQFRLSALLIFWQWEEEKTGHGYCSQYNGSLLTSDDLDSQPNLGPGQTHTLVSLLDLYWSKNKSN